VQRRARRGEISACFVGYTNAGKSSLFNRLTDAGVPEEDRLFATVDSTTRVLDLGENRRLVLSDTVGFIRKIPHSLIASFHATLEEAVHADLLLHVVDASDPEADTHVAVVESVLAELGVQPRAKVLVLNKIDVAGEGRLLPDGCPRDRVFTSALTGEGLDTLRSRLLEFVETLEVTADIRFPIGDEAARAFLHRHGEVLSERFGRRWTHVHARMRPTYIQQLRARGVEVQVEGEPDPGRDDP